MYKKIILTLLTSLCIFFLLLSPTLAIILPAEPVADTCTMETHKESINRDNFNFFSYNYKVDYESSIQTHNKSVPIVLITNSNDYSIFHYSRLADHLARNGFIVVRLQRPNNDTTPEVINLILQNVINHYGLKQTSEIGLIGHGVGGNAVIKAAIANKDQSSDLSITAVMTIAPDMYSTYLTNYNRLNRSHAAAYFTLDGSQDNKIGHTGRLRESFATFSWAGTEYSSTDALDKTMIFVHGANHSGLIGSYTRDVIAKANDHYIRVNDQMCITKGYANAFMRWQLKGEIQYNKSYMRGTTKPYSISQIKQFKSDYNYYAKFTNAPLQMKFQTSTPNKYSIENFEDNNYSIYSQSEHVSIYKVDQKEFIEEPYLFRDYTDAAIISFGAIPNEGWEHIAFKTGQFPSAIPNNATHFGIRIARLPNSHEAPISTLGSNASPGEGWSTFTFSGENQDIYLAIYDENNNFAYKQVTVQSNDNKSSSQSSDVWPYYDDIAKTEPESFLIPLDDFINFQNIDDKKIKAIYLYFNSGITAILVDNLEWVTD